MKHRSKTFAFTLCLVAAACDQPGEPPAAPSPGTQQTEVPAESLPAEPSPAAASAPSPAPSLMPPVLIPETEKGEKGARNVLLEWARAIERGDWARAAAQYGEGSSTSAGDLKALFGPLGKATVSIGDGDVEGGAGSLYYSVPFTAVGNGRRLTGEVVVRRVNDVDGASPAQLRWHIASATLLP